MGNQQQSQLTPDPKQQQILNSLEYVSNLRDLHYGDIKLMREKNTMKLFALKSQTLITQEEFEQQYKQQQKYQQASLAEGSQLIRLTEVISQSEMHLCSNTFILNLIFDYYDRDLATVVTEKAITQTFFQEKEIYTMMENVLSGLIAMKQIQLSHSAIQPCNIFYMQDSSFRITNSFFFNEFNNYRSLLFESGQSCYLSPELFKQLGQKEIQPVSDREKSDIYALGLSCLNMATLTEVQSTFDFSNFMIKQEVIKSLLNQVEQRYNKRLSDIIEKLLELEESKRPNYQEAQLIIKCALQLDLNFKGQESLPAINQGVDLQQIEKVKRSGNTNNNDGDNNNKANINQTKTSVQSLQTSKSKKQLQNPSPKRQQVQQQQQIEQQQKQLQIQQKSPQKGKDINFSIQKLTNQQNQENTQLQTPQKSSQSSVGNSGGGDSNAMKNNQAWEAMSGSSQKLLQNSLKDIENIVQEALKKSASTKQRFQSSQMQSFREEIAKDEFLLFNNTQPQNLNKNLNQIKKQQFYNNQQQSQQQAPTSTRPTKTAPYLKARSRQNQSPNKNKPAPTEDSSKKRWM